jgi:N-acetylmuramoyl-L-alanine amidase
MKAVSYVFLVITLLCPVFVYGQGNSGAKVTQINTVVIDAGHGGKDPGAVNGKLYEKDIVLNISTKLGALIKKNFPNTNIVYTRSSDKFVEVAERGRIANRAEADLFISIHINAAESSAATGTSTYVMGLDKANRNLDVAMKENDVVTYEEDYSTKYEGYKAGDPASYIIFSLIQSAHLDQSMQLAESVQKHFKQDLPMRDLGARQGPFLVLWNTSMPAILAEVGFISNSKDRAFISTDKGQNAAARSLFNAFSEYKSKSEGLASVVLLKEQTAIATAEKPTTATKPATTKPATQTVTTGDIKFYIQIAALSKQKEKNSTEFKSYKGKVTEIKSGTIYKYLVGGYATFYEASRRLPEVKHEFKDAYIVAFNGTEQVKLDEARRQK